MRRRPFRSLFDRPLNLANCCNGTRAPFSVSPRRLARSPDRIPIGRPIAAGVHRLSVRIRDAQNERVVSRDVLFRVNE